MKSIRVKLIAPFLIGLLVLALWLSWYTYSSTIHAVENAVVLVSKAKTDQTVTSMTLLFRSLLSTAQNIVVDPHVLSLFAKGMESVETEKGAGEWIEILAQGNDYYREIFITDGDGVCIASGNPAHLGKSFAGMTSVAKALDGMFTIDDFSVGKITKKLSSTVAGPIDMGGEIVGAIVIICDFPQIVTYGDTETKGDVEADNIRIALLEPDGMFAAHENGELMGNDEALFPALYEELRGVGRDGGAIRYTLRNEAYIGYARLEPVSRWLVISSGLKSKVFSSAYRIGFTVFNISAVVLFLVSAIVIRFADGILSSLLSLIAYAKRVSEGDFDSGLDVAARDDELGVLQSSLERLVRTLQTMLFQTREVSRMKGEFLANMSHEIRTPINAIIGMAHLSLRESDMSLKNRDYLEKIQTAARSLLGIISDILDISKIEAGKLTLDSVPFDIRQMLDDVLAIHQINAQSKSLRVVSECDANVPGSLVGDALRIGQVLNNLLSNAVKFTSKGGISLRCFAEDRNEDGVLIRIDVVDTGIGIDEASIRKLFQPFTQADASITRQFGGTGLGLAISRSLLSLMGGELTVQSEPGKGSTFTLSLRLKEANENEIAASRPEPTEADFKALGLGGKVILIAEDNAINKTILEELIAPSGADILLADNGQQAVDTVREKRVDLVLMDMQMPVMGGLEATRVIRTFADRDALPIIAVSANAMKEDKEEGYASGMNGYITKPVELRQLYDTLCTWLGGTEDHSSQDMQSKEKQ